MRFELVELMVTRGSKNIKEGKYLAIKDNEEIEDYQNGYCCDLEDYQPYCIIYEEIDHKALCELIEKAEEEDEVGYLCEHGDIMFWECMSEIECHEIES